MTRRRVLGAVLAGGASRRLGRDKAAESVGGMRLVDRAAAALAPHCEEIVVVSSRAETPEGPWARIPDLRPEGGPLAGIESALMEADRRGYDAVAVLAVDLPLVRTEDVERLIRAFDVSPAPAVAAAREGDPDYEPLCAVYGIDCLPAARDLLDAGRRAARGLFRSVDGVRVDGVEGAGTNVNDPEELDAVRRALGVDGDV